MRGLRRLRLGPVQLGIQLPLLESGPSWTVLDERSRGTRFLDIRARSIINGPETTRMPFWSLNPYVGCEFGCSYCYARDTHRWAVERGGWLEGSLSPSAAFERNILVKRNAAEVVARTLDTRALGSDTLMIGTATDPYQPAERRFRITRSVLELLRLYRGLSVGIITKSALVVRDALLLAQLAERHRVRIIISLGTADARLARRLEARSPVPSARLRALARLRQAGLDASLLIAPILPGITDGREALARLFAAARDAGATSVSGCPLRLGPAARRTFLPHLAREFPDLVRRYERHYARRDHASEAYCGALQERLEGLRREYGFRRRADSADTSVAAPEPEAQLGLL